MTLDENNTVYIIGLGAMGALTAQCLSENTAVEVIPLFRNAKRLSQFQNDSHCTIGIRRLYEPNSPLVECKLSKSYSPESFPGSKIQNLIVTTKTYQTKQALAPYMEYIDETTNIILIQNGLGVLEVLRDEVFNSQTNRPNLFQGVISHGAFQDIGFVYNHAGFADMKIARLPWDSNDILQKTEIVKHDRTENSLISLLMDEKFSKAFCTSHMTYQELLLGQLFKFLINSCINPVTAIMDCDNGEILDSCKQVFKSIIEESLQVLRVAFKQLFEYESKYNSIIGYPKMKVNSILNTEHMLGEIVRIGCIVNAKNSSSMRQDSRYLRDTEIDYINGYIVDLAKKLGLGDTAAKTNQTIRELVNLRLGLNRKRAEIGEWKYK